MKSMLFGRKKEMVFTSIIVMASGQSRRMGYNKLLLPYEGKTFFTRTLETALKIPHAEVIAVISPKDTLHLSFPARVRVLLNRDWKSGQSASVRIGTKKAQGEQFLYLPIDQPLLTPAILQQIIDCGRDDRITIPIDALGKFHSPILFGGKFKNELMHVSGSAGGRAVRKAHPAAQFLVPIKESWRLEDFDTPAKYCQLIGEKTVSPEKAIARLNGKKRLKYTKSHDFEMHTRKACALVWKRDRKITQHALKGHDPRRKRYGNYLPQLGGDFCSETKSSH